MKRDTLILILALICGAVAFALIFNFLQQAAQPKNQFIMTKKDLKKGTLLKDVDLTLSQPLKVPAQNYFTQYHEVLGKELQQDLPKGKLIARTQLKEPKKEAPAPVKVQAQTPVKVEEKSLPVPVNMRSLTLGSQEVESMPSVLKAGDYVDILGSVSTGTKDKERRIRTILHGVLILSTQKNEKRRVESVAVALTPNQVEMALNATKVAKLRFVITTQPTEGSTYQEGSEIEIIRGVQKETKTQ